MCANFSQPKYLTSFEYSFKNISLPAKSEHSSCKIVKWVNFGVCEFFPTKHLKYTNLEKCNVIGT